MFTIFIGSSSEARPYAEAIAKAIDESGLFAALPWWNRDVFETSSSFLESLFELLPKVDAAILVATPDDLIQKRDKLVMGVRDNVLFEYGLFAGHLGRKSAFLIQIGSQDVPTDLKGICITSVALPYKPNEGAEYLASEGPKAAIDAAVQQALAHLLKVHDGSLALDLSRVKYPLDKDALGGVLGMRRVLQETPHKNRALFRAPARDLRRIILENIQGDQLTTRKMPAADMSLLAKAYAAHVSRKIMKLPPELQPTRFAFNWRGENPDDMAFTKAVVACLQAQPVLVTLDHQVYSSITGRYIQGERTAFVHDFTLSGRIPSQCMDELRCCGLEVTQVFSFLARDEHLAEVMRHCNVSSNDYHPFATLSKDGELEIVS